MIISESHFVVLASFLIFLVSASLVGCFVLMLFFLSFTVEAPEEKANNAGDQKQNSCDNPPYLCYCQNGSSHEQIKSALSEEIRKESESVNASLQAAGNKEHNNSESDDIHRENDIVRSENIEVDESKKADHHASNCKNKV